jgi:hypothetical protein
MRKLLAAAAISGLSLSFPFAAFAASVVSYDRSPDTLYVPTNTDVEFDLTATATGASGGAYIGLKFPLVGGGQISNTLAATCTAYGGDGNSTELNYTFDTEGTNVAAVVAWIYTGESACTSDDFHEQVAGFTIEGVSDGSDPIIIVGDEPVPPTPSGTGWELPPATSTIAALGEWGNGFAGGFGLIAVALVGITLGAIVVSAVARALTDNSATLFGFYLRKPPYRGYNRARTRSWNARNNPPR